MAPLFVAKKPEKHGLFASLGELLFEPPPDPLRGRGIENHGEGQDEGEDEKRAEAPFGALCDDV